MDVQAGSVIPIHLPKPIKGAYEAGIWDRWSKLLGWGTASGGNEVVVVAAATMDGNVVVIFVVFVAGIAIGHINFDSDHGISCGQYFSELFQMVRSKNPKM